MPDQDPQDSIVANTIAEQKADQATTVVGSNLPAIGAGTEPVRPAKASALTQNRTFVYGAIAATIGIVAGLAIASLAGYSSSGSESAAATSTSSNAAALADPAKSLPPAGPNALTADSAPQTPPADQPKPSSHRKAKKKDLEGPTKFAIEGDDELVGYDPSRGIIQTSARKTFLVNTKALTGNNSAWQDWPANIHYKCDLNSSCTLTRRGASVLYAQLKK